jgi:ribosomal protein L18E
MKASRTRIANAQALARKIKAGAPKFSKYALKNGAGGSRSTIQELVEKYAKSTPDAGEGQ